MLPSTHGEETDMNRVLTICLNNQNLVWQLMIWIVVFVVQASAFGLPASQPEVSQDGPSDTTLRVLTYNIRHARGTDGRIDYERIAAVIKQAQPDLVALQEVDRATQRSEGVDQAQKLRALTGLTPFFAEAMPFEGGSYGVAILSRHPINDPRVLKLKSPQAAEPRVAAFVRIRPWGEMQPEVVFVATHLCNFFPENRDSQLHSISRADYAKGAATILAGDFNFEPDSENYTTCTHALGWVDAAAAAGRASKTYPAAKPTIRIDYAFIKSKLNASWRVIDAAVLDEPIASDHRPLIVTIRYEQ